ncbi:hypothetical protein HPP92_010476 [Vanilla planifolia]|uniref:Uncharacterized protein n=1 Tax=Vanilla planifolia TaxID=51239 RepID=A0A835UZT2_VANPL|nr:hypothetical protein HPP92_010476 [Vanilla planifolia]
MTRSTINSSQPKVSIHSANQLSTVLNSSERLATPPGSPVKTELALGPLQKPPTESAPNKFTGDAASIKRLVNGLLDKVSWQAEAASSAAAAVIQSKSGGGRRRAGSVKADTWLLFAGPDRVGKQKMANALADLVFGAPPLIVRRGSLPAVCGDDAGESYVSLRGRTSIDRVVDTLRLNPFSTIIFEDFDRTDCTFRGIVRRAMERGRLSDSHGREVGLGSSIFILATTLIPEEFGCPNEELRRSEERVMDMATSGRRLQLLLEDNTNKRRPEWLFKDERRTKPRKDSISLDLNLATASIGGRDEDTGEGSWISSDLTVEHEQEHRQGHLVIDQSMPLPTDSSSWGSGWTELIDAAIVFKPVDFGSLRSRVSKSVSSKFVEIMGQGGRSQSTTMRSIKWLVEYG